MLCTSMTSPKDSVALPCPSCSNPKPSGNALTSQREYRPKDSQGGVGVGEKGWYGAHRP